MSLATFDRLLLQLLVKATLASQEQGHRFLKGSCHESRGKDKDCTEWNRHHVMQRKRVHLLLKYFGPR